MDSQFEMHGTITNAGRTLPEQGRCWACGGPLLTMIREGSTAMRQTIVDVCQACGQEQLVLQYEFA